MSGRKWNESIVVFESSKGYSKSSGRTPTTVALRSSYNMDLHELLGSVGHKNSISSLKRRDRMSARDFSREKEVDDDSIRFDSIHP